MAPARLTRPYVGFSPTMPQQAAGRRIEPPVSEPSAPKASCAATAAPEPLEEPPEMEPTFHGLSTLPSCGLSPKGPSASSVMLSLPSVTAPAAVRRATAVAAWSLGEYAAVLVPHDVGKPTTWKRSW